MTTTPHTLSQLADIGAAAARNINDLDGEPIALIYVHDPESDDYINDAPAREAFVQAILDAIGYKLPVDPEREAFDKWAKETGSPESYFIFAAWKAGRDELRKVYEAKSQSALDEIIPQTAKQPENDGWTVWPGGERPVPPETPVLIRCRDGNEYSTTAISWGWEHHNHPKLAGKYSLDIIAYKIIPQTTTK